MFLRILTFANHHLVASPAMPPNDPTNDPIQCQTNDRSSVNHCQTNGQTIAQPMAKQCQNNAGEATR